MCVFSPHTNVEIQKNYNRLALLLRRDHRNLLGFLLLLTDVRAGRNTSFSSSSSSPGIFLRSDGGKGGAKGDGLGMLGREPGPCEWTAQRKVIVLLVRREAPCELASDGALPGEACPAGSESKKG